MNRKSSKTEDVGQGTSSEVRPSVCESVVNDRTKNSRQIQRYITFSLLGTHGKKHVLGGREGEFLCLRQEESCAKVSCDQLKCT